LNKPNNDDDGRAGRGGAATAAGGAAGTMFKEFHQRVIFQIRLNRAQAMADLEYFRQQKRAGRQSYFASRVHKGRGRRVAPSSNAASEAPHESQIPESIDVSNEPSASVNAPADRFLKRITAELFQAERISASSIQTSILELDSVVQVHFFDLTFNALCMR
jgi:hypothetical protein